MGRQKNEKSYLDKILKDKTNRTYLYLILIFVGYILFLSQMNLSIAKLEVKMISGDIGGDSTGLISLPPGTSEGKIVAAMLPQDKDLNRPYSWKGNVVTLTVQKPGNGYDMLVDMERSIPLSDLTSEQKSRYDSLTRNNYHPCCNAPLSACGGKHSVATKGLIKKLLKEGWTDEQISKEVFLWQRFWWPKHYSQMAIYLVSQGIDPSKISPKEWVSKDYSTIRSGRVVAAELKKLNLK